MKNLATSFRLTTEVRQLLAKLAHKLGISQASVIEIAVRKFAKEEGIE